MTSLSQASDLDAPATALSQDGTTAAAFELGLLPAAECGTLGAPCWTFQTRDGDDPTSPTAVTRSTSTIEPDTWYHITAVRDATTNTLRLYVCDFATGAEPILEDEAATSSSRWTANGSMQLGQSRAGAGYHHQWAGRIDDVRAYNTALGLADIIALDTTGRLWLYPAHGNGSPRTQLANDWQWADHIVGVTNWAGNGLPGIIARAASTGYLYYYPYTPGSGFGSYTYIGSHWGPMHNIAFAGHWDHDAYPDLLAIWPDGTLRLYRGNATGTVQDGTILLDSSEDWRGTTSLTSGADFNGDGTPDILSVWNSGNLWLSPLKDQTLHPAVFVSAGHGNHTLID